MALTNAAAGFIGASVTLVLVIIFMILMVILVRQCLAFISKRNAIRAQVEQQRQIREQIRQRRGSVTEPIPATFDWHHSIRIEGTPPPSYVEAKKLPTFEGGVDGEDPRNQMTDENSRELGAVEVATEGTTRIIIAQSNGVHPQQQEVVVQVEEEIPANQGSQDQTRTFTTQYTEFNAA